ncbi:MAG: family 43 glycosylhydrolase [Clostridia bacterium]|nr:family 43 glycosylhydrolase [Clostridia bacterium]
MKNQVFNPYLPSYEYIPDGEPHIFNGRVYVYGSHDKFGSSGFCVNNYVTWSAPVEDLSDWRYEGVILKREDDPNNKHKAALYAPDVCQGPDGRYYIYFSPAPGFGKKTLYVAVAVSDSPAGPFTYHGKVDLSKWIKSYVPFDPAVYVEDGHVYLYYGSGVYPPISFFISKKGVKGGAVVELDPKDMYTVITEPVMTVPMKTTDTTGEYGDHVFFEASSMRKIGSRYYFVYSSQLGHELCYAVGDTPTGPFTYGGILVSNGDIGLGARTNPKTACNYTGNTHGGLLNLGDKTYVFYHRHTNRHDFARQDCAELLPVNADGSFGQAEVTSCGLNGGPLAGTGEYEARIACHLTSKKGDRFYSIFRGIAGSEPFITQTGKDREDNPDQYVANIHDGTTVGYKYFDLSATASVGVRFAGKGQGKLIVRTSLDGSPVAEIAVSGTGAGKQEAEAALSGCSAKSALYFTYEGKGSIDLHTVILK